MKIKQRGWGAQGSLDKHPAEHEVARVERSLANGGPSKGMPDPEQALRAALVTGRRGDVAASLRDICAHPEARGKLSQLWEHMWNPQLQTELPEQDPSPTPSYQQICQKISTIILLPVPQTRRGKKRSNLRSGPRPPFSSLSTFRLTGECRRGALSQM